MLGAMVDPTSQAEPDAAVAATSSASTAQDDTRSGDVEEEVAPAPTPFDHPLFLPAVCIGFTVWFGYDNPNPFPVHIPVGSRNRIDPAPQGQGQVTSFQPGRRALVFSVPLGGTWWVDSLQAVAGPNTTPCSAPGVY